MDDKIRSRILGGVIVLVIAVIVFLQLLRNIPPHSYRDIEVPPGFVELELKPPPPVSDSLEIKEKLSEIKENVQTQAKNSGKDAKKTVKPKAGEAGLDAFSFDDNGIPVRWVVQVASLKSKESAQKLKQELADKGFISFTHSHKQSENDIIYAVYVGPTLQKDKALHNKGEVDRLFQMDSIIRKWN